MDEKIRYERGLAIRREVLGDTYVDASIANCTELNAEFQEMLTRHAWGEVWGRPGLPRHTRSLITIALLIALNQWDELRLHLRSAANNGVSEVEIKELLLHCSIYCGIPAVNSAFHVAAEVFKSKSMHGDSEVTQ